MNLTGITIVSGGQTGADRAALDWAIAHGIAHRGWCPRGRTAEDGAIASKYQLHETPDPDGRQRTEWNVRDSDGTVVFSIGRGLTGGSLDTLDLARRYSRPVLHLSRDGAPPFPGQALENFIQEHGIKVLNVAGPRASIEPEVVTFVTEVLNTAWKAEHTCSLPSDPMIHTDRMILRPLAMSDALDVVRLAGRREIADTTISIPHPLSPDQARSWIAKHTTDVQGKEVVFALTLKSDGCLVGTMGLRGLDTEHSEAEIGFWVAVEHWGQGYATEAAQAVLRFAFGRLQLNRVHAHHMVRNPASGRVLQKLGMKREGLLRQRVRKWGVFEDVVILAILREDWISSAGQTQG